MARGVIYSNAERRRILADTDHLSVKAAARAAGVSTFTIRYWRREREKILSGPPNERRRAGPAHDAEVDAVLLQRLGINGNSNAPITYQEIQQ